MKSQENKIEITGHLVGGPKLRPTNAGRQVCDMRLLVHNGAYPSFSIAVSAFDAQATFCAAHLSRGDEVRVEGALRFRRWRDRAQRSHEDFSIAGVVRPLAESLREQVTEAAVPARLPTMTERRQLIRARAQVRSSLPLSTFRLWVKPLRLGGITTEAVHLVAPPHVRAWTERRYSALIANALREENLPDRASFATVEIAD